MANLKSLNIVEYGHKRHEVGQGQGPSVLATRHRDQHRWRSHGGRSVVIVVVCLLFTIPLHTARSAMAAAKGGYSVCFLLFTNPLP